MKLKTSKAWLSKKVFLDSFFDKKACPLRVPAVDRLDFYSVRLFPLRYFGEKTRQKTV